MKSMTGYAALDGAGRRWELRSVNGRGLDVRFRLPDRPAGLEPIAREKLGKTVARGNVTLALKLGGETAAVAHSLDEGALNSALTALAQVRAAADAQGVALAADTAADVLGLRGVWDTRDGAADPKIDELVAELDTLIADFDAARAGEGAAMAAILSGQVDEIATLVGQAEALAPERAEASAAAFRTTLARLAGEGIDDARVAQEVAVLAVKGDITEELDRLRAHIDAARALIADTKPMGRRLDFLTQEFNREANTLCSKAGHTGMTAIGLELKSVIDRLREQVQNVE